MYQIILISLNIFFIHILDRQKKKSIKRKYETRSSEDKLSTYYPHISFQMNCINDNLISLRKKKIKETKNVKIITENDVRMKLSKFRG